MSTGQRVPLLEAHMVATELAKLLGLGCERIEVAGSIRRKSADVGDIELVAVPRTHREVVADGLFEATEQEVDELQVVLDTLLMDGTLKNHPTDPRRGPRYSKLLHPDSGLQVDLFSARRETFGLILAIRTGPSNYSQWLVTEARARGFHVVDGELHRGRMGCGALPCPVVPTPEEADVFTALQIYPLSPEARG